MKSSPLLSTLLALGLSSTVLSAATLRLTEGGAPKAVIVLGEGLRPGDTAVKVLVSNLKEISGATLPVISEKELGAIKVESGKLVAANAKPAADAFILLGESDAAKQLGLTVDGLGAGGILVKTADNALALLAKNDGSDAHAPANVRPVYNFLEALGCRSLWPGETGKVMPHQPTIEIAGLDVHFTPSIGQRVIRFAALDGRGSPEGLAALGLTVDDYKKAMTAASDTEADGSWAAWNGLGGNLGIVGGAAGCGLRGGWDQWGAEHPEWFALQADGTRDQSKAKERWRLCVSNAGLVEHVANDIIGRLKEKPQSVISLCPNDGGYSSFCLCPECAKLDPPNAPKVNMLVFAHVGGGERTEVEHASLTDRFVHYWNAVVERVTKEFPQQLFVVEAYSYYSDAPVREKLHPNLVMRYVPNSADGWKAWQEAGASRVYWRPNNLYSGCRDGALSPRARDNAATQKYLAAHGMLATDMDSIYHHWATHGLHYYSAARLDWNPSLEFDTILDDYCQTGFGAGAAEVKKYFLLAEKGVIPVITGGRGQFPYIAPETITALRASLVAAARATENDPPSHRRVAFLRTGFEFTAINSEAHQLERKVAEGAAAEAAQVNSVMERRWQMMRAILQNQPLAVNVGIVSGNDSTLKSVLKWKGPSEAGRAGVLKLSVDDDWLNGDQSATRK